MDAQPNRTREHFAKQLKALNTVVFVKNYKIKQILEEDGFDKVNGCLLYTSDKVNGNYIFKEVQV